MRRSTTEGRPTALAVMVCALVVCGCTNLQTPRIDPSGEHLFADRPGANDPSYRSVPGSLLPRDPTELILMPQVTVAPVGSEVVLLAAVRGPDQYLRTNQRVEWMLEPGGVGQFVEVDRGSWTDLLVFDFTWPRKIDNTTAVGTTSRSYLRLTRGTPNPADDVYLLRGQTWITVTSAVEGASHVTAHCPGMAGWESRRQSAVIHWIDAQVCFPPPAINLAGTRHVFTTTVTRQTDQSPCANWLVRYEICGGPAAGFAPDGAQVVEVPTDGLGQASVEIFQQQAAPGTNNIGIQVIRPALPGDGQGAPVVVSSGSTLKTWQAADIAVRKTGPAVASLGATLTYRLEVSNPGDMPAGGVVLRDVVPEGLSYLSSNPAGQLTGGTVQWQLGQLTASETRTVEVNFKAERQGSLTNCAEVSAAGGLTARDCASTTVSTPTLGVQMSGPERVAVGGSVTFEIVVTNRGQVPATGLLIKDRFDPGLAHAEAPGRQTIERDLFDLAPGQSQRIGVELRATRAGSLCNSVEVIGGGGVQATARACVTAVAAALPPVQPPIQPPIQPGPGPGVPLPRPAGVSIRVTGPQARMVGETAEFAFDITNTGGQTLTNLKVISDFDASFKPAEATGGHVLEGDDLAWTVATLPPGKIERFRLNCRCLSPAAGACNRVKVMAANQGVWAEDEACVEIRPAPVLAPANLAMTLDALREPVTQGKEFTYLIQVRNNGFMADSRVALDVTLPPELLVVKLKTVGPTDFEVLGRTIRFQPVAILPPDPNRPLEYRIRVIARQAGEPTVRAQLTSQGLRQPILAEKKTLIFAGP